MTRDRQQALGILAALAILGTLSAAEGTPFPDETGALLRLGPDFNLAAVTRNQSTIAHAGTAEIPALRITTQAKGSWPGVNIPAPGGAWDLSGHEFIALDIHNVDTKDIDVYVRIDNPGADGQRHCMTERIGTQPDQRVTLSIPLKRENRTDIQLFGMKGYPQGLYAAGGIDPAKIVAVTVFTDSRPVDSTFEVSNLRAFGTYREPRWAGMGKAEFFPCIDEYGQFIHQDWPGKVTSDADLVRNRAVEAEALAADAGPQAWNRWGGWANGPALKATGSFRTEKHAGKWWLVDPDGKLFFSTGLCVVNGSYAATAIEDREHWFRGLPAKDSPLGKYHFRHWKVYSGHYAGREPMAFDFTGANLARKYGADWAEAYAETLHRRFRAWGINTIANWSDAKIYGLGRTPYVATFWYASPKLMGGKANFPDPFDPAFAKAIDQRVGEWLKASHDDPWCIGYFVDNEMSWGGDEGLAQFALASGKAQAAKLALKDWLGGRHADIAALNSAWGTAFADWDGFLATTDARPDTAAAKQDLRDFTGHAAETYYRTIREIIRKHAPNRLYLGCRSVGGSANTVAAAVKHCDVVSYNRYCASVRDIRLPADADAPVIIGEFHFGAYDRGPFWGGLFTAENQDDRARKYTEYVRSALDNPQIVGVHWFQFGDEATTGRAMDGENAQCGFVDVCDTPYTETVDAARKMGETMYQYRFNTPHQGD